MKFLLCVLGVLSIQALSAFAASSSSSSSAAPAIKFISASELKYPVIKREYSPSNIIYYVYDYDNGIYRGLPSSFDWNNNGQATSYVLSGSPPSLAYTSSSGASLPLEYAIQNGKQTYYVTVDGVNNQLTPTGAVLNSLPPLPGVNWVPASRLPYPIVKRPGPDNSVIYWAVSNGKYVQLKQSIKLIFGGGKEETFTLGGNPPGLYVTGSSDNLKYPLFYALKNGQIEIYGYINNEYFNLDLF